MEKRIPITTLGAEKLRAELDELKKRKLRPQSVPIGRGMGANCDRASLLDKARESVKALCLGSDKIVGRCHVPTYSPSSTGWSATG